MSVDAPVPQPAAPEVKAPAVIKEVTPGGEKPAETPQAKTKLARALSGFKGKAGQALRFLANPTGGGHMSAEHRAGMQAALTSERMNKNPDALPMRGDESIAQDAVAMRDRDRRVDDPGVQVDRNAVNQVNDFLRERDERMLGLAGKKDTGEPALTPVDTDVSVSDTDTMTEGASTVSPVDAGVTSRPTEVNPVGRDGGVARAPDAVASGNRPQQQEAPVSVADLADTVPVAGANATMEAAPTGDAAAQAEQAATETQEDTEATSAEAENAEEESEAETNPGEANAEENDSQVAENETTENSEDNPAAEAQNNTDGAQAAENSATTSEATAENTALQEQIQTLRQEIAEMKAAQAERDKAILDFMKNKYDLQDVLKLAGALGYVLFGNVWTQVDPGKEAQRVAGGQQGQ